MDIHKKTFQEVQEELKKWSKETVDIYLAQVKNVGEYVATSFYNQSDLSRVKQCELMILGINPGCGCIFSQWDKKDCIKEYFLYKGNPCFQGKSNDEIISALFYDYDSQKHRYGWDLIKKIYKMLTFSGKGDLLKRLDKFVLSNMIFFGTAEQDQIPKEIDQELCARQTLKLIDILKPKVVLLLGKQSRDLYNTLIDGPKLETIVPQSISYCYKDCHILAIKHTACRYTSYEMKIIGNTIGYALDNPTIRLEKESMDSFLTEKANGRSWYLKTMINGNGSIQKIYNEETVYHDFYTTTQKRKYVSSKDNIVIDLTPTKDEYKVLVFTRQNDKEKTMKLIKDVWPDENYNPWDCDNSRHVHRTIPLCESNENVAKIMEQVLSDIKAYRDKAFPLHK